MPGPIAIFMNEDHDRLDRLRLSGAWWEFRGGLLRHNALEEGAGGFYDQCDALAGTEAPALVERLRAAPEVAQNPYQDGPRVRAQVDRVLAWLAARRTD